MAEERVANSSMGGSILNGKRTIYRPILSRE